MEKKFKPGDWVRVYKGSNWEEAMVVDYFPLSGSIAVEYLDNGVQVIIKRGTNIIVEKIKDNPLNFKDFKEFKPEENKCTCGAAHTSSPNFHLKWCDLEVLWKIN